MDANGQTNIPEYAKTGLDMANFFGVTQNGDKISIPNKGYYINNKERGKLIIRTEVAIPKKLNDKEKELFLKLKKVSEFNPNNIVDIK